MLPGQFNLLGKGERWKLRKGIQWWDIAQPVFNDPLEAQECFGPEPLVVAQKYRWLFTASTTDPWTTWELTLFAQIAVGSEGLAVELKRMERSFWSMDVRRKEIPKILTPPTASTNPMEEQADGYTLDDDDTSDVLILQHTPIFK